MADDDTNPLIVPVRVDALVVNRDVRKRDGQGFRRWAPNFQRLAHHLSPEPGPFQSEIPWTDPTTEEPYLKYDGVYVRWEVPAGLRHAAPRTPGGNSVFPLVPNRWLVVRHVENNPGLAAGWVVESDYLDDQNGTSATLHPVRPHPGKTEDTPYRATVTPTMLGRRQDIGPRGTPWNEPARRELKRKEMFLSSVGPGLMTFHAFQPYHQNVFSLHDELKDGNLKDIDRATVDYQVVGWHSDPGQEELLRRLKTGESPQEALAALEWTGPPAGWQPTSTAYCGRIARVAWNRAGGIPASDRPDPNPGLHKVKIAFGSGADEATAALLTASATARRESGAGDGVLLHALGRGLVDTLDEPDGDILTAQAMHRGWFEQRPGGYVWRIVDTSEEANPPGTAESVTWSGAGPDAEALLAQLNRDQDAHDTAARELAALQSRLYALWWMNGLAFLPKKPFPKDLSDALDPSKPASLAVEVARRQSALTTLLDKIPHGQDATELADSVRRYLSAKKLPAGCELRREALPPFFEAMDPTIVLGGATSHQRYRDLDDTVLVCRLPSDLKGTVKPGDPYPEPFRNRLKPGELPGIVAALLGEFVHLLANPTPELLPVWRQPWKPLLYQWTVRHWPVPFNTRSPSWEFDGATYQWKNGDAAPPLEKYGRRFLVPLPQYTMSGQLDRYAADLTGEAADSFAAACAEVKELDLLSQSTDGLTDALACRDAAPNVRPSDPWIADLVGEEFRYLPNPGPVKQGTYDASGFTQIRAGQLALTRLSVIDEFGQTLDVVLSGDAQKLKPIVADSVRPGVKRADKDYPDRLVQLPPRLLQPARLRFDFVSEHNDDEAVDLNSGTTPVCGWIVPNYVDRALLCYAPTGAPLGEVRLAQRTGDTATVSTVVQWAPLPDSNAHRLEDLRASRPHLYRFASHLLTAGPATFLALLSSTDRALAGVNPGNPYGDEVLSTLLGRPLALVRTRLGFELDGPPLADPGWKYALDWKALTEWRERIKKGIPPEMDHLAYPWPVRLGNPGQQGDGLLGYFSETAYDRLYAVATPAVPDPAGYVQAIGSGNWPRLKADSTQTTHLTLLIDPQAAVHATTDVLPVTELRLPSRFTRTAMAALRVALRLSPVLTTIRRVPTTTTRDAAGAAAGAAETGTAVPAPAAAPA
ncbi:hypothetical protein, partial [Streptomyces corynorhini]